MARKQPLIRPATADENAVVGHPLPKGEGSVSTKNVETPGKGKAFPQVRRYYSATKRVCANGHSSSNHCVSHRNPLC